MAKKKHSQDRYYVRDARITQYSFRKIQDPWKVIDGPTNKTVDECTSARAARMTATQLNREHREA